MRLFQPITIRVMELRTIPLSGRRFPISVTIGSAPSVSPAEAACIQIGFGGKVPPGRPSLSERSREFSRTARRARIGANGLITEVTR